MVDERLVHAEVELLRLFFSLTNSLKMREVSPSSVAVTARNRKVWDEEKLEKLENEIDQLGSLLAERLLEKQALLRSLQDRLLAEGIREGLESRAAHYDSLESVEERLGRIEVVVKKLEGHLEEKEATRSKLKLNIKNDRGVLNGKLHSLLMDVKDKETFQIEGLQTDLRSTSTTSRTYVYIVVDYLPQGPNHAFLASHAPLLSTVGQTGKDDNSSWLATLGGDNPKRRRNSELEGVRSEWKEEKEGSKGEGRVDLGSSDVRQDVRDFRLDSSDALSLLVGLSVLVELARLNFYRDMKNKAETDKR
eukprot:757291-Hanusia_phi.AAC.4